MNGIKCIADTNAFVYLLEGNELFMQLTQIEWSFSFITEIELLSKSELPLEDMMVIRQMLGRCTRVGQNQEITEETIKIRRNYKLKLPDAIIGATAIVFGLPLLTADLGFQRVKELDLMLIMP